MKTVLRCLFLIAFATVLVGATLTVDIPTNDVPRVSAAFGDYGQLGHSANINEVSYLTRLWIVDVTKKYEASQYKAQYSPTPLEMQPTPTPTPSATATATGTPTP